MSPSSSSTLNRCRECGTPLSPAAPDGFCPCCLIEGALRLGAAQTLDPDPPDPTTAVEDVKARVGVYDLLEEIGRGGMGVVYRARQRSLNRIVAVKMILSGQFAGKHEILRFRAEAEMAAKLSHPNIVAVHESGEHQGQHYFSMDFVQGRSLAEIVRDRGPLPAQLAAAYARTIAEAIHYAHQQGVLHRDLKPSNVLVDAEHRPRITDFGLARHLRDDFGLTVTGQVLGSPNFMSPEQASSGGSCNEVHQERSEADQPLGPGHVRRAKPGPLTDVYGIGAILYHSLTGRPPFQAASLQEVLLQLREAEPVSPRRLDPSVPRDLETICLKCLEKEPRRRYQTAEEVAHELRRFLNHEPLLARPVSPAERVSRWCKRKPVVAALVIALNVALALGLAGILWEWRRAVTAELTARQHQYVADMNLVKQVWVEGNLTRAQGLLRAYVPKRGEPDLRGFEWRYLWNLFRDESKFTFPKSSSGVKLASGPNRTIAAVAAGRAIRLLDCARHSELGSIDVTNSISALTYSAADSNLLAVACGPTLSLWNLADRRITSDFALSGNAVSLAISPDGKLLAASTGQARTVELWRLENPTSLWRAATPTSADGLTFTPDGRFLVSGGAEQCDPIVWDLRTGSASPFSGVRHGIINTLAFSPDGQLLASGSTDSSIVLWDFSQRRLLARLEPSSGGGVTCIAFSPDGRQLVAGHEGAMLRLWDTTERKEAAILRGHEATIRGVAFSSDGRSVISAGADGFVKLWDSDRPPDKDTLANYETWAVTSDFSPDTALLASGTTSANPPGTFDVWDIATRRKTSLTNAPSRGVSAFSPDGKILAQAANDRILLWNTATFSLSGTLTNGFDAISLSFSLDGRMLAAAGREDFIRKGTTNCLAFWDLSQKAKITKLQVVASFATVVSFAHRAPILAVGHDSGTVRLWNYNTEQLLAEFTNQRQRIWALAFSPDDQWLSAGGEQGIVEFYDVPARRAFAPMARISTWVAGLCFAPDGKTLASAEGDGTVNLWNVATREIALILRGHAGPLSPGLSFSPDGNLLVSSGADGKVRLWPATPADKIPRGTEEQP